MGTLNSVVTAVEASVLAESASLMRSCWLSGAVVLAYSPVVARGGDPAAASASLGPVWGNRSHIHVKYAPMGGVADPRWREAAITSKKWARDNPGVGPSARPAPA